MARDNYRSISKWAETIQFADQVPKMMRRAFTYLRTGRPGPVVLEVPMDVMGEEFDDQLFHYEPVRGWKTAGDPESISRVAKALLGAHNPVIRAGNGILYGEAWKELREFAELTRKDWDLILPYLEENERLFGVKVEELLTVDGRELAPEQVYRKVRPTKITALAGTLATSPEDETAEAVVEY